MPGEQDPTGAEVVKMEPIEPDVITSITSTGALPNPIPSITSSTNETRSNNRIDETTNPSILSGPLGNDNDHYGQSTSDHESLYGPQEIVPTDEIIREIDVYISPELAKTMNLIQFPLQPASHTTTPTAVKPSKPNRRQPPLTQTEPPVPRAARLKPKHSLLELDYAVPTHSFSTQRSVPEVLDLSTRTYTSQEIPMVTHMALGLFDETGKRIDLVPLKSIMQMRPTFRHIDAVFDDDDLLQAQAEAEDAKKKKGNTQLLFKRAESERTIQMRESSYAYKRLNEEKEEWLELDVHGPGSMAKREAMKKFYCPREVRGKDLKFVKPGKIGGGLGYVKSLNYLPNVNIEEDAEEDFKPDADDEDQEGSVAGEDQDGDGKGPPGDNDNVPMEVDGEEETESSFQKELTDRIAKLLQGRGGVPIPYPVIRTRYHVSITDENLLQAISASAALVRGNFLLKSSLLGLSSPPVANARDLILILLNKYGFVQQDKLMKVYDSLEDGEDIAKVIITHDILGGVLDLVGKKTLNGVELKVDDDPTIEEDFPEVARMHNEYWKRKEALLYEYVELYEGQM